MSSFIEDPSTNLYKRGRKRKDEYQYREVGEEEYRERIKKANETLELMNKP